MFRIRRCYDKAPKKLNEDTSSHTESETFVVPKTVEHRHAGESVFVEFRLGLLLTWEELLCAMHSRTRGVHYRAVRTCFAAAEALHAMVETLFPVWAEALD
ncbi:unnamed protein product [Cercospora beticola]|nr:unnamed protein product [Cercospora beticola]